jgi:hypothetical protein
MSMIGDFMPFVNPGETETYEIRQLVKTVKSNLLPVVYDGPVERVAMDEYDRLVREHPGEYFELVKVVRIKKEKCLAFTPIKEGKSQ